MTVRNVLFLTQRVPYPPDRGDRIRAWNMLKHVAQRANVYLAATTDEAVTGQQHQALDRVCAKKCFARLRAPVRQLRGAWSLATGASITAGMFHAPALARQVHAWRRDIAFDAAIVYCSSMFGYVSGPQWKATPKFVDLVDVDSAKWEQYAQDSRLWKRWLYARESRAVARLERRIAASAATVAVTTAPEARLLARVAPGALSQVLPNGVDTHYFQPTSCSKAMPGRVVFTGVLNYKPNVDAVHWFVDLVWNEIRRRHPQATLEIVGKSPQASILALQGHRGISVAADVPDVRLHLYQSQAVIAPLQIARGVQNKVLEAFAAQRAVVASPGACEGLGVHSDEQILCAHSPAEWVHALGAVLADRQLRERIAAAGRRYVETHHAWDRCLAPLDAWLDEVAPGDAAVAAHPHSKRTERLTNETIPLPPLAAVQHDHSDP